jgi:hypothetical protein
MRIRLQRSKDAFAVIVVFVLLTIMSVYVISNAVDLNVLKRELRNIEKLQERNRKESLDRRYAKDAGDPGSVIPSKR